MKKVLSIITMILFITSIALAGCGQRSTSTEKSDGPEKSKTEETVASSGPITINQEIPDQEILSKGPSGEAAVSAKT
ncbi:MAG: sugar ABC transporter substrate-binding protein, partial [Bacillus sp. (in: firmicutes)]